MSVSFVLKRVGKRAGLRGISSSPPNQNAAAIIVAGLGVAGVGILGRRAIIALKESRKGSETTGEGPKGRGEAGESANQNGNNGGWDWMNLNPLEKRFYDGGFEPIMTKREAALILGVRESAALERIKEAHRRILMLNHPDKGGSKYMAAKINEAKEMLLKGRD